VDADVKQAQVPANDTIILYLNENSNPTRLVNSVTEWLGLVGGIVVVSHQAEVLMTVEPSQVDDVSAQLPQDKVVIVNVTGPVEDQITAFKKNLPDRTTIIIMCGFIGMIVGAIGLFIDSITQLWDKIRVWLALRRRKLK